MCGIAGQISRAAELEQQSAVYEAMQQTLLRRGPDQQGIFLRGRAALIHARLSVVDLEKGRQPMHLRAGEEEYVLVYNGELYNTEDLRARLVQQGHRFEGHSDTEVLLHAYQQWGTGCLQHFNGIFAFAVWSCRKQELFLARDRMGVKPLFYTQTGDSLIFGSELKALLAHPAVEPLLDRNGVAELMLLGPGRTPGCGVFRGIEELPPAHYAVYTAQGLQLHHYWRLQDREHRDNFEQTVETVRFLVTDAIERQLVSDVPVCTFLSGGLDSSIISAVADRYMTGQGRRLQTFSVSYRDNERYFQASKFQPESDDVYIELMNEALQAEHHQVILDTAELVEALFAAVDARDLPGMADVDSSLLLFCREIKKWATVGLSGECADEIFGGYPWYRDPQIRAQDGFPWAQSTAYRAQFLRPEWAEQLDAAKFVDERYRRTVAATEVLPQTPPTERRMKEMMRLNLDWFMQTLLDRKDRMSMYNGLEVRVPFCDYRIAEYLYGVPWEFKDYQQHEKGLLRQAMTGLLPQRVLWRKKSPYPKTHNPAYLAAVSERLEAVLARPDAPLLRLVRCEALQQLLQSDNVTPWYGQLMTTPQTIAYMLQLNYWLEKYQVRFA